MQKEEDSLRKRLAPAPAVTASSTAYTNPFAKPSDKEVKDTLKAYDQQAKELEATGADTSDLQDRINEARKEFKGNKDKAEWGQVAQMIAQSLAKAGAAMEGQRGGYAGIPTDIPTFDYEKRLDRTGDTYSRELGLIEKERDNRRLEAGEQRQAKRDALAGIKEQADFSGRKYMGEATDYRQGALGAMRANVDASRADAAEGRAAGRAEDAEKARVQKESLKELRDEASQLQKQDRLVNEGLGLLSSANPKDRDRAVAKLTEAGIPASELDAAKERANESTKNWFSADPQEVAEELKKSPTLLDMRNRINELKQSRGSLIGRGEGQAPELQQQQSPAAKDSKILDYAKQYGLSYMDAEKVLVGRGYKPTK